MCRTMHCASSSCCRSKPLYPYADPRDRARSACVATRQGARHRLMTISGIGTTGATALAASVSDPSQFRSGRQFEAWLGLTPLQKSNGGKVRLGPVTKLDNRSLRKLLVVGMAAVVRHEKRKPETVSPELIALLVGKVIPTPSVAPRRARQT